MNRLAFCALLLATLLGTAHAEGDIVLTNTDLQSLLGPTLTSTRVQLSSTGGAIQVRLPNGATIQRSLAIPPFEAGPMTCTLQPIENAGPPTMVYRDGAFQFSILLRPVSGNLLVRTSSIWPNITATQVQVDVRFRLGLRGGSVVTEGMSTAVTGNIDLTGIGSPFSPVVRPAICQQIATQVQNELRPQLDLVVGVILPLYLSQATGYGPTLRISGQIQHERDRVVFPVTGQRQAPPRPQIVLTGVDPSQINPDALRKAASVSSTQFSLTALPIMLAPGVLARADAVTLGTGATSNGWRFQVVQQELLEKGGVGVAITLDITNETKEKRTLIDSGFDPHPTLSDAGGALAPQLDEKDALVSVFSRVFAPGERARVVLRFAYPAGVSAKKITPEQLFFPVKGKNASLRFFLK